MRVERRIVVPILNGVWILVSEKPSLTTPCKMLNVVCCASYSDATVAASRLELLSFIWLYSVLRYGWINGRKPWKCWV